MMYTDPYILEAIEDLLSDSQLGDKESMSIVETSKLDHLRNVLAHAQLTNKTARDRAYLTKTALETQNACNPRPVSTLLTNAIHLEGAAGGNPAMENSPLVRLILNTLLNILGPYHELPAYSKDCMLYSHDCDSLEAIVKPIPESSTL